MTTPTDNALLQCREAFEKWFFEYRAELLKHNITLDSNDANSAWSGFEAAWNTRALIPVDDAEVVEAEKWVIKYLKNNDLDGTQLHGWIATLIRKAKAVTVDREIMEVHIDYEAAVALDEILHILGVDDLSINSRGLLEGIIKRALHSALLEKKGGVV